MEKSKVSKMNERTKEILHKLREDEMDIEEAIKVLNVTEEELWDLLDNFEYFPSGNVIRRASQIERDTLKELEKKFEKSSKNTSQTSNENSVTKYSCIPSNRSNEWLNIRNLDSISTSYIIKPEKTIVLRLEERGNEILRLVGTSTTSKENLSLLQFS
jgi:hypothetical protein